MSASPSAEEAVKLFEALQDWIVGHVGSLPLATGSSECQLCPLCQALSALRTVRPEAVGHFVEAATQFAAGVYALFDPAEPESATSATGPA